MFFRGRGAPEPKLTKVMVSSIEKGGIKVESRGGVRFCAFRLAGPQGQYSPLTVAVGAVNEADSGVASAIADAVGVAIAGVAIAVAAVGAGEVVRRRNGCR